MMNNGLVGNKEFLFSRIIQTWLYFISPDYHNVKYMFFSCPLTDSTPSIMNCVINNPLTASLALPNCLCAACCLAWKCCCSSSKVYCSQGWSSAGAPQFQWFSNSCSACSRAARNWIRIYQCCRTSFQCILSQPSSQLSVGRQLKTALLST